MNINYKLIGTWIKYYRKKKRLSQMQLAELADLSVPYISFVETGKKKVSLSALIRIANALDTTPNHILIDYIPHSEDIISSELTTLLSDCSSTEKHFICDMLIALRRCIRANHWFTE